MVEVDFANIQGVFAQSGGNFVHHGFDTKHALRSTKTTESSRALGIGFAAVADQLQSGDVVDVINVQTSAVIDGARVVRAVTATRHESNVCAQDTAVIVKPYFVVDSEIVALTSDGHVIVAVHPQLHRLLQLESCQGRALAEDAGIAFFAAKTTTHTTADHFHVVGMQIQRMGCFALVAVGVLGRHIQSELSVFFGHRIRDLPL